MKEIIATHPASLHSKLGYQWREIAPMASTFTYDGKYDYMCKRFNTWRQCISNEEFGVLVYALSLTAYFENPKIYDRIIFYEDLSGNTEDEILKLFDIVGVDRKYLPLAMEAMKKDSQNGTFGKRGKGRSFVLEPELLATFNDYMKDMKIPKLRHELSDFDYMSLFNQ